MNCKKFLQHLVLENKTLHPVSMIFELMFRFTANYNTTRGVGHVGMETMNCKLRKPII